MKDWLLRDTHPIPGEIKRATMYEIKGDSVKFRQVVLNSPHLEASELFIQLLSFASALADLTFTTPPLKSTRRSLTCKINHWVV